MSTEAALLRARGAEVTLGGQSYRLRYDFDALEKLETEFDGLDNFINDLSAWAKRYRTVRRGLIIGLASQVDAENVGRLLNEGPISLPLLINAINDALSEGIGVPLVDKEEDSDPKAEGSGDSPGDASTGTPLSVLADQTPSSGE